MINFKRLLPILISCAPLFSHGHFEKLSACKNEIKFKRGSAAQIECLKKVLAEAKKVLDDAYLALFKQVNPDSNYGRRIADERSQWQAETNKLCDQTATQYKVPSEALVERLDFEYIAIAGRIDYCRTKYDLKIDFSDYPPAP